MNKIEKACKNMKFLFHKSLSHWLSLILITLTTISFFLHFQIVSTSRKNALYAFHNNISASIVNRPFLNYKETVDSWFNNHDSLSINAVLANDTNMERKYGKYPMLMPGSERPCYAEWRNLDIQSGLYEVWVYIASGESRPVTLQAGNTIFRNALSRITSGFDHSEGKWFLAGIGQFNHEKSLYIISDGPSPNIGEFRLISVTPPGAPVLY